MAARARKEAVKREEAEKKKKAEEDAYWQDDNKNVARKQRKASLFTIRYLLFMESEFRKIQPFWNFAKFITYQRCLIALVIMKNIGLG